MSADLLRRAATKLREHAEAAKPGPWDVDHEDLYFILRSRTPVAYPYQADIVEVHSPDDRWADFDYFALMHPPVALALATWLDFQALAEDAAREAEAHVGIDAETLHQPRDEAARSVARAVLREPADGTS